MAIYTTTFWELKSEENLDKDDIFDFEFDFYDIAKRDNFIDLFYDYYFDREIGFETLSLFKHKLKNHLNMLMPKYKMLYDTQALIIDPLLEFDYMETMQRLETDKVLSEGGSTGVSDFDTTSNSDNEAIHSDTPQGYLQPSDLKDHATDVATDKTTSTGKQLGTTTNQSTNQTDRDKDEQYTKEIKGNRKSQAELLNAYRDLWYNIDKMIIDECKGLFMGVL